MSENSGCNDLPGMNNIRAADTYGSCDRMPRFLADHDALEMSACAQGL